MLQWIRSLAFVALSTIAMPIFGLVYAPWAMFSLRGAYVCCKSYSRFIMWLAEHLVGMRCEVRGTPPQGGVLIAAKHQSFLDIMMIFQAVPLGKFIMKKEILWTPVIGQYAKRMKMYAVDRGKRGAAVAKMLEDVKAGHVEAGQLIIYSQGTRVAPGVSAPYKKGTAALYEQMGQTCVPVATNVGYFWPRRGLYRRPGVAVVEFLDPIPPGLPRDAFMTRLEQTVEARSDALLEEAKSGSAGR
ncbi:1-acyl-sn-glycerol-3-phosphate acyltransferase [Sulfitobacter marinus]|uniref:1-acyl-sn-glycerol-3-phosphate acyltransferase n=1 Tax=Sulfitobacter marinus TaxID=394264 RepID=A0A1I6U8B5_9RHOB|nr:lysophospholipid acyltransferase family protein [Sulfitobacter marinus]SFS97507.1 1-acyl-sn-glycerol-3-phosphate acyltransferase [Sulfitobacter marinus]